jgi:hypothetical protein
MWEFLFVQTGKGRGILCVANVESLKYVNYKRSAGRLTG